MIFNRLKIQSVILIIVLVITFTITISINPEPIHGEVITISAVLGIGCVLAVMGLIFVNRESIINASMEVWDSMTFAQKTNLLD